MAKDLSAVRYQLVHEDSTVEDTKHFETLRRLEFFTEFENIEIWEVLRVAVWREVSPNVALIREGDRSKFFGVIVSGSVEVSIEGKALCRLGPSEPVGEVAFLHPSSDMRCSTAVTLEPTLLLEINAAALALSSEELLERVRNVLLSRMIKRMRKVNPDRRSPGAACGAEPVGIPGRRIEQTGRRPGSRAGTHVAFGCWPFAVSNCLASNDQLIRP